MVGFPYSPFRVFCRTLGCVLAVSIVVIVSACGSTSTESLVGPGGPKCAVSLTGPSDSISASGGAGTVAVSTQPECEWTASADASWITALTPTTGQGSGPVQFQVIANPNGTTRQSAVTINGQRALIQQNAAACELTATASNTGFPASGGAATISISVPAACPWTASSNVSWITVSPASGSGSANVGFTVAVNPGAARTGTVTAGGVSITVAQSSAAAPAPTLSCTLSLQPSSTSTPAGGGSGTIGITTNTGCPWTASSTVSWITLTTTSGSGNGSVGFTVAANTTTAGRTGSVNISGAIFTVNQAGTSGSTCTITINPASQAVPAAGASGINVAVSASGGCAWTATSNAGWLSITAGATGTGNGTVKVDAAANTGAARTGTVTIGGQTFTVNQAAAPAPCTYSINPTAITVGEDKVSGLTVAVTAGAGCSWNATAQIGWLHIAGSNSGSGNGTVTYNVDEAKNPPRTGTLTIAGQTLTVTQVQCSATLNPQTQAVPVLGGSFTVSVNTQIGCGWQAVESLSWVTVTSGSSSTGSGTVGYTVAPNVGGARSGTIAISGQTLTVNQAAVLP